MNIRDIFEKFKGEWSELIGRTEASARDGKLWIEYNMSICIDKEKGLNHKTGMGGLYGLEKCDGELIATYHTHPPNTDEAPSVGDIDAAELTPHKYMCIGTIRNKEKIINCWKVDTDLMWDANSAAVEFEPDDPEGDWTKYNETYKKIHKPILSARL